MRKGLMLVLCIVLALVIVGGLFAEGSREEVEYVRVATAGSGGNYYRLGAGMASLWNDEIEGIQASIQSTGGSVANLELLADKEVEIAFVGCPICIRTPSILWPCSGPRKLKPCGTSKVNGSQKVL